MKALQNSLLASFTSPGIPTCKKQSPGKERGDLTEAASLSTLEGKQRNEV